MNGIEFSTDLISVLISIKIPDLSNISVHNFLLNLSTRGGVICTFETRESCILIKTYVTDFTFHPAKKGKFAMKVGTNFSYIRLPSS